MTAIFIDARLDDDERRRRTYAGDIFIFSPSDGTRELIALVGEMIVKAFAPHDPRTIHRHLSAQEVAAVLSTLKPAFIHHPECKRLIPLIMREHGIDLEKLYFDVPRLRSAYPCQFLSSGIAYAYHPHRDTWYSAPMSQIIWWLPVHALDPDHAMGIYPGYFDTPVSNDSETYNYYDWNANGRATAPQHVTSDTRAQPKPQQELNGPSLRCLPPPGGIVAFSGAHLHETVPNTTEVARYSIDFRTVHLDDVMAREGAANLDSRCTGTTLRDYLCAADPDRTMPADAVSLYNDCTATPDKVLRFGEQRAAAR